MQFDDKQGHTTHQYDPTAAVASLPPFPPVVAVDGQRTRKAERTRAFFDKIKARKTAP